MQIQKKVTEEIDYYCANQSEVDEAVKALLPLLDGQRQIEIGSEIPMDDPAGTEEEIYGYLVHLTAKTRFESDDERT